LLNFDILQFCRQLMEDMDKEGLELDLIRYFNADEA
jgi:hypothetical protein